MGMSQGWQPCPDNLVHRGLKSNTVDMVFTLHVASLVLISTPYKIQGVQSVTLSPQLGVNAKQCRVSTTLIDLFQKPGLWKGSWIFLDIILKASTNGGLTLARLVRYVWVEWYFCSAPHKLL